MRWETLVHEQLPWARRQDFQAEAHAQVRAHKRSRRGFQYTPDAQGFRDAQEGRQQRPPCSPRVSSCKQDRHVEEHWTLRTGAIETPRD